VSLACPGCNGPVSRMSRSGLCFSCFYDCAGKRMSPEELGSRRYFEAIEAYRDRYERRAG